MEFPITRERLQNYLNGEAQLNAIKNLTSKTLKQFREDVEHHVMMGEKRFVYKFTHINVPLPFIGAPRVYITPQDIRNYIVSEIERMLPDCTLTVDPLETYMIIDWS